MADDKTWPQWVDVLGLTYRPGDRVAIATINGRSPQMVIGTVLRIKRVNSRGEPITTSYSERVQNDDGTFGTRRWTEPSCTVRVQPEIDARGFGRGWGGKPIRAVTYSLPKNILRVVDDDD